MATAALALTSDLGKKIAARAAGRTGGIKNLAEGRSDVHKLNPVHIEIESGFNIRDFDNDPIVIEHVDNLAQSIAQIGVQRPLKVRNKGNRFILVDGECRLRATIRAIDFYGAEIHTVPVIIADRSMNDADATLGLLVENSGLDVTPLGKGEAVKRLINFGWSKEEVATKSGMSKSRIGQLLDLVGLGSEVQALIKDGTLTATAALGVAREVHFDDAKIVERVKAAVEAKQSAPAKGKAAASAKTRVTARALTSVPSLKSALATIIGDADVENVGSGDDATVILTISAADYAAVKTLLKLA